MRSHIFALVTVLAASLAASPANAGRGSSTAQINSAIRSGSADAIISELERAERLVCGACIEPVMALLDHEDYRVREAAAWWFARRPMQKSELFDLGVARLYGDDATAARNAADMLGTFRHANAIPALSYAAGRADLTAEARAAAVQALGAIGHRDGEAAIVSTLSDSDASVRLAAVNAYAQLRGTRDGQPLAALVSDADVSVRRAAATQVGAFRVGSARAALETVLGGDADPLARRNAAWALGRIGDAAARPALEAAAQSDTSSIVRSIAQAALGSL